MNPTTKAEVKEAVREVEQTVSYNPVDILTPYGKAKKILILVANAYLSNNLVVPMSEEEIAEEVEKTMFCSNKIGKKVSYAKAEIIELLSKEIAKALSNKVGKEVSREEIQQV